MSNRPIKFRVWNKEGKSFCRLWDKSKLEYLPKKDDCSYSLGELIESENFIVQQFTGLKDSTGKEIYEGDILRCSAAQMCANNTPITYSEDGYGVVEYSAPIFMIRKLGSAPVFWAGVEVVGNIFENPQEIK